MAILRVPPHNEDAETSVLGAVLLDKDAISTVSAIINPNDFYSDLNGIIYESMLALYEERKPIDILTLTAKLKKNKSAVKIDSSYIAQLVENVPSAANIEYYAQIVKETSMKRAIISTGGEETTCR